MPVCTTECFFGGHLTLRQPRDGYRFSLDPFLLCAHARPRPGHAIMDVGTGTGIIALTLALKTRGLCITAVEIQPQLAALAHENVSLNRRQQEITVVQADIHDMVTPGRRGTMDMVIANPPFRKKSCSRINPHPQKAIARHEISLTLEGLVTDAAHFLTTGGILWIIYPVDRLRELLPCLGTAGLAPEFLRFVHPRSDRPATRVLVMARKHARPELQVCSPLYLHGKNRAWTREARLLFNA